MNPKWGKNLVNIKNFLSDSYSKDVTDGIMRKLNYYFAIDCFFYQLDDQWNNRGFISNHGTLRLAPKFNNSGVLGFSFSPTLGNLPHYLKLLKAHVEKQRPEKGVKYLEGVFDKHKRKYKGKDSNMFTTLSYSRDTFDLKGMKLFEEACKTDSSFIGIARSLSSINANEIISKVEDRTGVAIPPLQAEWFKTVADLSFQYTDKILKEHECNLEGVDLDD